MASSNSFKFVMLPPQTDTTREWARRLAKDVPEVRVVVAEDANAAAREITDAEAAFGWLGKELLPKATKLRWLQAPQAAPAAGYYYPQLVSHSVNVTNFREIYNDHIGAHILAFVLAFARGLHMYIPQQLRREWKKSPEEAGDVIHLPEATALVVGLGGIGAEAARLPGHRLAELREDLGLAAYRRHLLVEIADLLERALLGHDFLREGHAGRGEVSVDDLVDQAGSHLSVRAEDTGGP